MSMANATSHEGPRTRDFRCNGCGSPLQIPKNSRGHVRCPSCKTECVIEGLVKNAEIAAKDNINSGIPLTASPATLHRLLVKAMNDQRYLPLDAYEKLEVVREERHCVPAYLFDCSASASFRYEHGVERRQSITEDNWTREKRWTEWQPITDNASVTLSLLAPGEKNLAKLIQTVYLGFDPKEIKEFGINCMNIKQKVKCPDLEANSRHFCGQLVDIEELEFPYDVETHAFNLPQNVAFNEYIQPLVEGALIMQARCSLSDKVRNFRMGGSKIDKEIKRVFLGLYRIVMNYGGTESSIWVTGDGQIYLGEMPRDSQQEELHKEKQQALASVPGTFWLAIGGLFSSSARQKRRGRLEQKANAKADLEAFESQWSTAAQRFKESKTALRGIYQDLTD